MLKKLKAQISAAKVRIASLNQEERNKNADKEEEEEAPTNNIAGNAFGGRRAKIGPP